MSNTLFAFVTLETVHHVRKGKRVVLQRGRIPGGMYAHRATDLCERGEDLNEPGMQNEENDLLVAAVGATREYAHKSGRNDQNHVVGRAGLHMQQLSASKADRSTHNHPRL